MTETEPILVVHLFGHGYCQQCGRPEIVGQLTLRAWKHQVLICASCLALLARDVSNQSPQGRGTERG